MCVMMPGIRLQFPHRSAMHEALDIWCMVESLHHELSTIPLSHYSTNALRTHNVAHRFQFAKVRSTV